MEIRHVDLYEHFGMTGPEDHEGKLTLWHHATSREVSPNRRRPAVLILPGGGYSRTSDREAEPVAYRFLAMGYVPFVLRYTCGGHPFPVQLREAAMAMRYIRQHAQELEVDPHMVAAMGFSAGGHLCGTLGTMFDCPEVADIGTGEQIRPDALALCYPVTLGWGKTHAGTMQNISGGDEALRMRLSLDSQVRPDMPPTYLWCTRDDGAVPCRNSIILAEKMDEAGVDFTFHLYRHGWHGLSLANDQVYRADVTGHYSPNVPGWVEDCYRFWGEIGFHITDLEE